MRLVEASPAFFLLAACGDRCCLLDFLLRRLRWLEPNERNIMRALLILLLSALPLFGQTLRSTGYKPLTPEKRAVFQAKSREAHGGRIAMLARNQTLPASFDCRDKGWALPVGDQGNCGSCYLYSTVQTASAAFVKAGYGKPDGSFMLAVQYGMDCGPGFGGCDGGNGTEVIDWMCKNGWPAESYVDAAGKTIHDYPGYEARERTCRTVAGAKKWTPASWGYVNDSGKPAPAEIKTAMYNYGVLNIALDAGGQFGNGTGTITSLGNSIDHEIQVVAWDDAKDGGAFLLQNQWNTDWGNNGYRWCTYNAARSIVDWFWVSAAPLPPPPPVPPTPPVPPIPPVPPPHNVIADMDAGFQNILTALAGHPAKLRDAQIYKMYMDAWMMSHGYKTAPSPVMPPAETLEPPKPPEPKAFKKTQTDPVRKAWIADGRPDVHSLSDYFQASAEAMSNPWYGDFLAYTRHLDGGMAEFGKQSPQLLTAASSALASTSTAKERAAAYRRMAQSLSEH